MSRRIVTDASSSTNTTRAPVPTAPAAASSSSNANPTESQNALDFIGTSPAVKDLFSLPYVNDRPIHVAVHNLDGTLLLMDAGDELEESQEPQRQAETTAKAVDGDYVGNSLPDSETASDQDVSSSISSNALVALSSNQNGANSEALTMIHSVIENATKNTDGAFPSALMHFNSEKDDTRYTKIPPSPEPREYLNWNFQDLRLLVGSSALIYRAPPTSDSGSQEDTAPPPALTVRVEELQNMKQLLHKHHEMIQSGQFLPNVQSALHDKSSYAEAVRKSLLPADTPEEKETEADQSAGDESDFSAPILDQVKLQTCVVAAPASPLGGYLPSSHAVYNGHQDATQPNQTEMSQSSTPISTVLDIYLDNIMANVPQLALCLEEKGFIQSVKLLKTEEIPSGLLQQSTLDATNPFEIVASNPQAEQIFSPQVLETNASTLLRFLKTNCTRDNSTYLLRREAGQTNIQLYDVSAISEKRQRKWISWLSMISYRFAHRLRHVSQTVITDPALQRSCRARQRSLLQNTLDLLEVLSDMDGHSQESLVAAVREHLADTFLGPESGNEDAPSSTEQSPVAPSQQQPSPATAISMQQPYGNLPVDALNKAQDNLKRGIKMLLPVLNNLLNESKDPRLTLDKRLVPRVRKSSSMPEGEARLNAGNNEIQHDNISDTLRMQIEPVVSQLFGLHYKFVNVSLRLAEIHLQNYYSSSAMQALRSSARAVADSVYLFQLLSSGKNDKVTESWIFKAQLQYTWLWENLGHFSRSFAADELWRERGHVSGDDVISLIQDADSVFIQEVDEDTKTTDLGDRFLDPVIPIAERSKGALSLHSLDGLVYGPTIPNGTDITSPEDETSNLAVEILNKQKLLLRERRRALVAACLAYSRAIQSFKHLLAKPEDEETASPLLSESSLFLLLHQRLGDACNEAGKIMLNELRQLMSSEPEAMKKEGSTSAVAAKVFLSSAEFWFRTGLEAFTECGDLRNLALLRCNLCQSWKLKANAVFTDARPTASGTPTHAESCLQEAANQLHAAHEALSVRDTDPMTWDMVSDEMAATYLVLGVRRRQSLIGSGNMPMILQALRLSPGQENSIVEPMERSLTIYEQLHNYHQAAAAHYQLALFYSKIWTCQLNEAKTREKLSAAFHHYNAAHAFFSQTIRGNEVTFCLLCIDLSSLYASVSGEECTTKALLRCLDTVEAMSGEAIESAISNPAGSSEWFTKMDTLGSSIEERVFKHLRTLVKLENEGKSLFKDLYRVGLQAKMAARAPSEAYANVDDDIKQKADRLTKLHAVLISIRDAYTEATPNM